MLGLVFQSEVPPGQQLQTGSPGEIRAHRHAITFDIFVLTAHISVGDQVIGPRTVAKVRDHGKTCSNGAGQPLEFRQNAMVKTPAHCQLVIARAEVEREEQYMVAIEAGVHAAQLVQSADEQRGSCDQQQRQRDLRDDQALVQSKPQLVGNEYPAGGRLQHWAHIHTRRTQRRSDAEQYARDDNKPGHKREHAPVGRKVQLQRFVARSESHQHAAAPDRNHDAQRARSDG